MIVKDYNYVVSDKGNQYINKMLVVRKIIKISWRGLS